MARRRGRGDAGRPARAPCLRRRPAWIAAAARALSGHGAGSRRSYITTPSAAATTSPAPFQLQRSPSAGCVPTLSLALQRVAHRYGMTYHYAIAAEDDCAGASFAQSAVLGADRRAARRVLLVSCCFFILSSRARERVQRLATLRLRSCSRGVRRHPDHGAGADTGAPPPPQGRCSRRRRVHPRRRQRGGAPAVRGAKRRASCCASA